MNNIKIKFCGLFREEDIEYVNKLNPDYIGFVFAKSKRQITKEKAIGLKNKLKSNIKVVGVFVDEDIEKIIDLLSNGVIDIAQLHGNEREEDIKNIKNKSKKQVIKAIRVTTSEDIESWKNSCADFLLLDNGQGTGKTFDWNNIKNLNRPFFLAGGLSIDNIKEAIEKVSPMAIDISSGIESNGVKDYEKMKEVMKILER
ncbi:MULTISPECIES: phosphoribosylanthranilate isomerase [Clostridia]|uniref:N-(5'-phosphoribosyl)anthranilate isomerase n=1 Tax=Clostridium saudiense TaxID=1414720 RepID=A0ABS2FB82_9CLOT|nr:MULTISPECIES: phosphoribosylanthranilate isomerase [Clostridiaceae]MBM6817748.1 phosphoribosylanthranilate isomerase [Clostridium saudiense]